MKEIISRKLSINIGSVSNTLKLLEDGATVPFIARYRKEVTKNLDEVQIRQIRDTHQYLVELGERKQTILNSIEEQGKLTDELKRKILSEDSKTALEDIYLPYKPKRKTRASVAIENGLEPLADLMMGQSHVSGMVEKIVLPFINDNVPDADTALQGARDIVAERINVDTQIRAWLRSMFLSEAIIKTAVNKKEIEKASKYQMYFDYQESAKKIPSHRLLAVLRGESEGFLKIKFLVPDEKMMALISGKYLKSNNGLFKKDIQVAIDDSLQRLILPSITTDVRQSMKEKADIFAVSTFSKNLRQLLLASPLGSKPLIALDPGFRTGIKLVVIDATGKLMFDSAIYPLPPHSKKDEAFELIDRLFLEHKIAFIAVGNGTAGRETETFVKEYISNYRRSVECVMVNEAGASVFSVSDTAREEFPDLDATVRGAVSIGRRLHDPLAELVKIDPKSLGVGQYQHDVNQVLLKNKLDEEVEHCVNLVGVDLNTASQSLLSYVSGIGKTLAKNIVEHRNKNGLFRSRDQVKNVPKFGPKSFEQSAGFLRIRNGSNPLDSSAIHPESYGIVKRMLTDLNTDINRLMGNDALIKSVEPEKYFTEQAGKETVEDILLELHKPGLDPREEFQSVKFLDHIREITDLKEGMVLPGVATNVADFGVFVDLGVHQDGLIHISQLSDNFVKDPCDVVKIGQNLKVKVLAVDVDRKRISLSLRGV